MDPLDVANTQILTILEAVKTEDQEAGLAIEIIEVRDRDVEEIPTMKALDQARGITPEDLKRHPVSWRSR